tara:strand:+ start:133 stop:777 length:645 start_codon:yes stop_codon:yes gene_type:complete
MKIKSFIGGYDKNLSYIVWCEETNYAAIIDASVKPEKMIDFIIDKNLRIKKLLITHSHGDHVCFMKDWIDYFSDIIVYGYDIKKNNYIKNNIKITNNEIINIGNELIISLYTPGHYYDSICFWDQKNRNIFTGDTIFVGRTGRVISNRSSISDLYNSIYNVLLKLPEETMIFPGHHYGHVKQISFKDNKVISDFFNCNSESEFIKVMNNFEKNR